MPADALRSVRHLLRTLIGPEPRQQWGRTVLLSLVVGLLAGLSARALESAVQLGYGRLIGRVATPGTSVTFDLRATVLLLPAVGGLVSGLVGLLCRPSPAHGTAVLIDAFHHRAGEMSLREGLLKAAAAAAVIAFGGSVGKEAAIAVLGASIGSRLTGALGLAPRERRLFLVAGCAAGVGAIFQCPLGGAIFATSVLYREPDIEADALMPSIIASVTSYSTFMAFGGYGHRLLQGTNGLTFAHPVELAAYAGLGVLCAAASGVFFHALRGADRLYRRLRAPAWLAPVIGGLGCGLIALAFPQVMDARYAFVQNALDGRLAPNPWLRWLLLFTLVVLAKCLATALMMGARSAGGLFGPVVFIGGATGAAAGALFAVILPGVFPESLRAALIPVGMAGVLSASLRTPLAAIVMVTEMTGTYGLIVPLMLVSVLAYVLGRRFGVYAEQLGGPLESPAHAGQSVVALVRQCQVAEMCQQPWPYVVRPATPFAELVKLMPAGTRPTFAVLDGERLLGVISMSDVSSALELEPSAGIIAADIVNDRVAPVHPEDDLYDALERFRGGNLDAIPVVQEPSGRGEPPLFVGMLTRGAILKTLRSRLAERRELLLREHAGLATLEQEGQLEDLLSELGTHAQDHVHRMLVPEEAVGHSLRELDFRRRFGAQVVAVETADGLLQSPPDPVRPLSHGDVLVVLRSEQPALGGVDAAPAEVRTTAEG